MSIDKITVQSPGRINLIGEHTDYNDGFVLPAAIDKKTVFKLHKNKGNKIHFEALNVGERFSFDSTDFSPIAGGWQNYVMGVVHELQKIGGVIGGFDAQFEGDVPIGSGMSSSAALECSLAFGLNELFELKFDKWQLIKACQMAEHNFVGIKCGIMDQFASVMGKQNQAMLLDCQSLDYQHIPLELKDYQFLLLNTNVTHSLASSEYNTRRSECESGIEIIKKTFPKVSSFRDVSLEQLQSLVKQMPEVVFNRCLHVVTENRRVLKAVEALKQNDFKLLGELMYRSHLSLDKNYNVSCPELNYLVELTTDKDFILGSRMMGGGFGGCTINLIKKTETENFIKWATPKYQEQFGLDASPYIVNTANGAGIL